MSRPLLTRSIDFLSRHNYSAAHLATLEALIEAIRINVSFSELLDQLIPEYSYTPVEFKIHYSNKLVRSDWFTISLSCVNAFHWSISGSMIPDDVFIVDWGWNIFAFFEAKSDESFWCSIEILDNIED